MDGNNGKLKKGSLLTQLTKGKGMKDTKGDNTAWIIFGVYLLLLFFVIFI